MSLTVMGGFDHQPATPDEPECKATSARNSNYGLWLFFAYLAVYAGFVLLNAFRPETMEITVLAGVNLAVWYGFALIIAAFILSLLYGWLCRMPADTSASSKVDSKEMSR